MRPLIAPVQSLKHVHFILCGSLVLQAFLRSAIICRSPLMRRVSGMASRVLYVYRGEGADENARDQLFKSLQNAVNPGKHSVAYISPEDIIKGDWTRDSAMLAIGGGYDLGLIRALKDKGLKVIRDYVKDGGSYFGLCSGAYFASDHIEFDKGGPLEVCGERHLNFFSGLSKGPVFPGFQYQTFEGAVATPLDFWNSDLNKLVKFHTYFNGGGFFKPYITCNDLIKNDQTQNGAIRSHINHGISERGDNSEANGDISSKEDNSPKGDILSRGDNSSKGDDCVSMCHSISILGKYTSVEENPAAIVKTKFGKGAVVLSSSHIEYNIEDYPEGDPYVDRMMDDLKSSETNRKQCFLSLLRHLNISCISD